jgi:hypothetical protein
MTLLPLDGQLVPATADPNPKLNNSGDVTMSVLDPNDPNGTTYAAIWRAGQPGKLIAGTGGSDLTVTGINDSGTVIGYGGSYDGNFGGGAGTSDAGFRANPSGSVTYYPWFQNTPSLVQPGAINNAGVIAANTEAGVHIFGNGVDRTDAFPREVVPTAINSANHVTGFFGVENGATHEGMFVDDGTSVQTYVDVAGRHDLRGFDINDAGTVVGFSGYDLFQRADLGEPDKNQWAFTFSNGTFTWLPGVDAFFLNSWASALNNEGWVVGHCQSAGTDFDATLWIDGQPMDLNALTTNLPDDMYLVYATDINDNGQIVALANTPSGNLYPILLTPTSPIPDPAALPLLSLIALRRKQRTL